MDSLETNNEKHGKENANSGQNDRIKQQEREEGKQKNLDYLNELHKNVQMGKYALEQILPKTENVELKEELLKQFHDFEKLMSLISGAIIELGATPKSATAMQNMMLKTTIGMSTLMDSRTSKIADMVIQGDNQGIMDINRLYNASREGLPDKTVKLSSTLLETEQRHIDALKRFL